MAKLQQNIEESSRSERMVLALYEALSSRHVEAIRNLLADDLEWWFHGPPSHQFMMRLLTGTVDSDAHSFEFLPLSVVAFGSTVLVEGCDQSRSICWVQAWTVTDGRITQLREYFNTSLTVTRLDQSDFSSPSTATSPLCTSVWESTLSGRVGKSVPGLVLAI